MPDLRASIFNVEDETLYTFEQLLNKMYEHNATLQQRYEGDIIAFIILRDIWLLLVSNRIEMTIAPLKEAKYPIRTSLVNLLLANVRFQQHRKITVNDPFISLLFAIVYLEFLNKWVFKKINRNHILAYYLKELRSFYKHSIQQLHIVILKVKSIPRDIALYERSFAKELSMVSKVKYSEFQYEFLRAEQTLTKLQHVVSCKNHILNRRRLIPEHLSDLFSIFYARCPEMLKMNGLLKELQE